MKSLLKAIDTIDAVAEAGSVGIRKLSSITGAAMRVIPDRVKQFGKLVKACAAAISSQLGFNPANAT